MRLIIAHANFTLLCLLPLAAISAPGELCAQGANTGNTDQTWEREKLSDPAAAPAGKLPAGVQPLAYRLSLELDPRQERFSGRVEIDIETTEASDGLWIHGKDLDVHCVQLRSPGGEQIDADYRQVLDSGVARIRFAEEIEAGALTLAIGYSADFDRNLSGLFRIEVQGDAYALAKSESIQARKYLPGFDEPGMKAPFSITLTIPDGYEAVSNGRELAREDVGGEMQRIRFAETRPLSTYLLSLAVGPFEIVEAAPIPGNALRSAPIPLRGIARRGKGDTLRYVLSVTPRMVEIFETELQQPYPYEKLDIIAAPQWPSGATELAAAITYREPLISIAGATPSPGARLALLGVHAHELAHMWFGNLVTPPWWDDLWLKEGFATWGTPLALTRLEPDGGHDLNAATRAISAMRLDSLASTRSIREPIEDNANVRNAYDAITYSKSLGVIHMVDSYFGAETFRPALGQYIAAFADGAADSPDFYQSIARETGTPELLTSFRSFVEQPGVPALTMTLDCSTKPTQAVLEQARYRPLGSAMEGGQRWTLPVCLRTDVGERYCALMQKSQETLPLGDSCPAWVLPNAGGHGYYRWQLADAQWRALAADFLSLDAREALSAVDSAFAAFEAGELKPDTLLRLIAASAQAPQRQVVTAPLGHLARYRSHHIDSQGLPAFQAFLANTYGPRLASLRRSASADAETQLLQSRLTAFMATVAEDAATRQALLDRARRFTGFQTEVDAEALSPDLYAAALEVAVEETGPEFVEHVLDFRQALDDPQFNTASAEAMGASPDASQIHRLLMGEALDSRERYQLFQQALRSPRLGQAHWEWLQENFPAVLERLPAQWRRRTPGFGGTQCSVARQRELSALFDRYGATVPGHERALAQTRERIALCAALRPQAMALNTTLAARAY